MLTFIGILSLIDKTIMGVCVASFAGKTLDAATRLQRYAITELAASAREKALTNKYLATALAGGSAGLLALADGKRARGLILWPLFGAAKQPLAALALLAVAGYLARAGKPALFTAAPFVFMAVMTGWAMAIQLRQYAISPSSLHLLLVALIIAALELWMIIEAAVVLVRARGPAGGSAAGGAGV